MIPEYTDASGAGCKTPIMIPRRDGLGSDSLIHRMFFFELHIDDDL